MATVTNACAHQVSKRPDTAAMPKRIGSVTVVSSGTRPTRVSPAIMVRSQILAIHGAAREAMRLPHLIAVETMRTTANPPMGR